MPDVVYQTAKQPKNKSQRQLFLQLIIKLDLIGSGSVGSGRFESSTSLAGLIQIINPPSDAADTVRLIDMLPISWRFLFHLQDYRREGTVLISYCFIE